MNILIAGGSGTVGTHLTQLLHEEGHVIRYLSRKGSNHPIAEVFTWNLSDQIIEECALEGIDVVINLAGAGVADSRWTQKRKDEIINSRVESVRCLYQNISQLSAKPKVVITASGKDYYGDHPFEFEATEDDAPGNTFLAKVCKKWEAEASKFEDIGVRSVQIRVGVVLDRFHGALAEIAKPIKYGVGAPLGSGKQVMSWIHVKDLCRMIIHLVNTEKASGAYNAVGQTDVTNAELTKAVAKKLKRPLWLPNVPAFVLKLMLGEMAEIVLSGYHVSNKKIADTGFKYRYEHLEDALDEIYNTD